VVGTLTGRVGIFGGAFDPPHNGHVALARTAMERLGLDRLHVTVVVAPGHKETVAPAEYRLELARLAFAGLGTVEPELYEYTVDALEAYGHEDPVFLIGADELADFPTWKEPERVLELARLGVATRPGYRPEAMSPRIEIFELEPHPVSSSEIRERVRRGEAIDGLVPDAVATRIAELGLYRDA
jgi:nicotinate-nucleotide adenylyltransferase